MNVPPQPPPRFSIWIGGDVHLGASGGSVFEPIQPLVTDAVGIVNLEGPVAEGRPSSVKINSYFGGPPAALRLFNSPGRLRELHRAGVLVVGIDNNHVFDAPNNRDFTGRVVADTLRAVRLAGFLPSGLDAGEAVFHENGLRFAVYQLGLVNSVPRTLGEYLRNLRRFGDVMIVSFHTTGPVSYLPRQVLREAAEIALDAGADIVVAHGSHALGPVERRGDKIVAWGLGNLVFNCDCTDEVDGLVLRVTFEGKRIVKAEVVPIDAGLRGGPARPGHDPRLIFDLLEALGSTKLVRRADRAEF